MVRNGSSSRTQFLPKRPRQLRSGYGGTFRPSSAPKIGFRGVETSNPWTINCGLFWRTQSVDSVTTAWDPSWRQGQIPLEERVAIVEWLEHLKACIEANGGHFEWHYYKWKPKTIANKLLGLKSGCFNFPSRSHCTCNRTYGKTMYNNLSEKHLLVCSLKNFS